MSVSNDLIDMDHHLLICKINLIEFALQAPGEEMANLRMALAGLESYAKAHFDREERLQIQISYPKYSDHKRQHQELIQRLQEIKEQILGIEEATELAQRAPQLTELLRDWLLVHVFKEDMKLKPFFSKYPSNYAPGLSDGA
jgi:hemerythrin